MHGEVAQLALEVALHGVCLELLGSVDGIGYQFAEENLMIAVEELFDDGEDVLGRNPNVTCFHIVLNYV